MIKFKLIEQWHFADYKGWAIVLGSREEGQMVWRDGSSDDPDFDYRGYKIMMNRDEGNECAYISDTVHEKQAGALEEASQWLQGVLN